jgi:hypothetical protein
MKELNKKIMTTFFIVIIFIAFSGCTGPGNKIKTVSRQQSIPLDVIKGSPESDTYKPVVHSDNWKTPVPMKGTVNTAGAEDSPFMMPDGNTFYFFFTPDVRVPANKQLIDGVTGIWWTKKINGTWTEPERIFLSDDVSLDGCTFVQGDTMWFGSVRAGNYGNIDVYTAKLRNGKWADWKNAGEQLNVKYDIGEFHISPDGKKLYFGYSKTGTDNGSLFDSNRDIYVSEKTDSGWSEPVSLGPKVNSGAGEDQPFITPDGKELWFTGQSRLGFTGPAIFRSLLSPDGSWGEPEEIISNFAGEPTLDSYGNVYFVHHFYRNGTMIEADIYVAEKK